MPETADSDLSEGDVLLWESGVSIHLAKLEEELVKWNAKERTKMKGLIAEGARALKDVASAEQQLNDSAAVKVSAHSEEDPWNERLEAVVHSAKMQREELREVLELLEKHATLHFAKSGGSAFVDKLPALSGGRPLTANCDEVSKHVKSFLEIAERKLQGRSSSGGPRDHRRHKGDQSTREELRANRTVDAQGDRPRGDRSTEQRAVDVLSSSRSRTPVKGRGAAQGNQRHCEPEPYSADEYSDDVLDSRSVSRDAQLRRGDSRRHAAIRHKERDGDGNRGRGASRDVNEHIDRFCETNRIESKCERLLREISPAMAFHVMGMTGGKHTFELRGDIRNPTGVVMARIRKAQDEAAQGRVGRSRPTDHGGHPRRQRSRSNSRSQGCQQRRPPVHSGTPRDATRDQHS